MKRVLALIVAAASVVGCRDQEPKAPDVVLPPPERVQPAPAATVPATSEPAAAPPVTIQAPTPAPVPAPVVVTPPAAAPHAKPVATIDGIEIQRDRVVNLLMESHGLNMLLRVVQVDLAKSLASKEGVEATQADIAAEREQTVYLMAKEANQELLDKINDAARKEDTALAEKLREQFKSDAEMILQQALARENMTAGEFALLMQTNANLRKVVEKQLAGKITEDNLREAFLNLYGENVRVRHIQLANISEVTAAQAKLQAGVPFQQVAREMSRNASTRAVGGDLLPFSRETQGLPDAFKQVAFSLKTPGEVSEPVEANGSYHLIQLVETIAPKAIKYEDVKESVRTQLHDRWVTERMKLYRDQLARKALDSLKIEDPVMAAQFRERLTRRESELKEREQISRELARQREEQTRDLMQPAGPTTGEAAPTDAQEQLRPPATTSGSDTPDQAPTTAK